METEKYNTPSQALGDFVMILYPDHTIKQGMSPDGLIGGKWSVDEKTMILIIKDDVTNQEYKMKITSFTPDELVLQDTSGSASALIHYRAK
jgi:hypothetical protein